MTSQAVELPSANVTELLFELLGVAGEVLEHVNVNPKPVDLFDIGAQGDAAARHVMHQSG